MVLAGAIDLGGEAWGRRWGEGLRAGLTRSDVLFVSVTWGLIVLAGVAVVFLIALALRNLGPVGPRSGDLPTGVRTPALAIAGLVLVAFTVLAAALVPVTAGAARAVDASEVALAGLWARWATHLLGTSGVLLLVAGVVEHLAMRHGLWRDLHMTRAQAREQSRQPGGR